MAFNVEKFTAAEFEARTETVTIPALAEFFSPDESPDFTVRGLTGHELAKANEAMHRAANMEAVVKAMAQAKPQADTIRKALGLADDTPADLAKRLSMVVMGCVAPRLTDAAAVKLATVCPVEFWELSNKILLLTGQGSSRVKQKPSSRKPTSKAV